MYCLSEYQAATSGLLHIVAKFCINIVQLRPSGTHNIQVPSIGNYFGRCTNYTEWTNTSTYLKCTCGS
jgi:hypothetical protein